ncbi:MAG TPA: CocE/NonD family hydrolase [Actinomycetota bacterium]|nr:CocE/NonD family hydrolase [Actinomycetota bacterium]
MKALRIPLVLAVLIAALAQASPAPAQQGFTEITVDYIVETRDGRLFMRVTHPAQNGEIVRAPVILTLSPYNAGSDRSGSSSRWTSRGYARAVADVIGTGNSGGCFDHGGAREKRSAYDLVEWIAKQKWSTGKIAMMGASYNGTTAIAAAVMRPPHLTTIVPEVAISRWYDYAYSGGIRYTLNNEKLGQQGLLNGFIVNEQGLDTPLAFDFGYALPPPVDYENEDWAERTQSTMTPCDELEHTQGGYDVDTPDYNEFWRERDYLKDAHKVRIPVLVAGAWGDWNVKQENSFNFFKALKNSEKAVLYMGSRWQTHGLPGDNYNATVDQWMDHYLLGVDNGIENMPEVVSEQANSEGELEWYSGAYPKVKEMALVGQFLPPTTEDAYSWQLMPHQPLNIAGLGEPPDASFPSVGINTESHAAHHNRMNHDWFWFESGVLKKDVRIFGTPKVQIYSRVDRTWVTYTPTLIDFDPGAHTSVAGQHVGTTDTSQMVGATRGWLDSRYRKSLAKPLEIEPGKPFEMTVVQKPIDYTFQKGHVIGLNIQTEINEWSIPKPYPCTSPDCPFVFINWSEGRTRLILPVVNPPKDFGSLFVGGHSHGQARG